MSMGLSHSNANVVATFACPQGRKLLILKTRFCESSLTSRIVSCENSPKITDSSKYGGNFVVLGLPGS